MISPAHIKQNSLSNLYLRLFIFIPHQTVQELAGPAKANFTTIKMQDGQPTLGIPVFPNNERDYLDIINKNTERAILESDPYASKWQEMKILVNK